MHAGYSKWITGESTTKHREIGGHWIRIEVYVAIFSGYSATGNHIQVVEYWCEIETDTQGYSNDMFHISDLCLDDAGEECKTNAKHPDEKDGQWEIQNLLSWYQTVMVQ